jgi:hypothetical protein
MNTSNNQLSLFQFGQPAGSLGRFLDQKDSEKDGRKVGVSVSLAKRKDIAKMLDLSPKKDASRLDAEMLKLTDELKTTIGREVTGIIGSSQFTGGRMTVRVNKQGMKRVTCSFAEVRRHDTPNFDAFIEKTARALGVTVAEVKDAIAHQDAEDAAASKVVEVEVTQQPEVPVLDQQPAEVPELAEA